MAKHVDATPPVTGNVEADKPGLVLTLRQLGESLWVDTRYAFFSLWVNTVAGSALVPRALRIVMLRLSGMRIGRAQVYPGVTFRTGRIAFGWDTMVNSGVRFDNIAPVTFGERVRVGPEALFCTTTHEIGPEFMRAGTRTDGPITIGDGAWIGARALILPGVNIGDGSVVAAGAVVVRDVPAHTLVAGVPAKTVRLLPRVDAP